MKKITVFLVVVLIGTIQAVVGQEVIYGTVRTDGYNMITKGAMWSKRPEARAVYEGRQVPPEVKIYILEKDFYARFVDEEHNNFDRNYIIFPAGEKVYTNGERDSHGREIFFSAKCGNKIDYLSPVDRVRIIEIPGPERVVEMTTDTMFHKHSGTIRHEHVWVKDSQPQPEPLIPLKVPKKNKTKVGKVLKWVGGTLLVGTITYLIFKGNGDGNNGGQGVDPPPTQGEDTGGGQGFDPPPTGE